MSVKEIIDLIPLEPKDMVEVEFGIECIRKLHLSYLKFFEIQLHKTEERG